MRADLEADVKCTNVSTCLDVSLVMPCLNEARTVGQCVQQARNTMEELELRGEIVVVDNGSTDGSAAVAKEAGARVVHCSDRGYGNAIRFGAERAHGEIIVMGDADASHDFTHLGDFLTPLEEGADLVIGNRFRGGIERGAMPWKNRYLGNPGLTFLLNRLFHTRVGDAHCGLRAFPKNAFRQMELECSGMEFASEMVVKAAKRDLRIVEVPTTQARDGRDRAPHLCPWRDGWRHLKFLLMFSPVHLFILPAAVLTLIGLILLLTPAFGAVVWHSYGMGVHWMAPGALLTLLGLQVMGFGVLAKLYAIKHRFFERDRMLEWFRRSFRLGRSLLVACGICVVGFAVDCWILVEQPSPSPLPKVQAAIVATVLMAIGAQLGFFSLLFAIIHEGNATKHERPRSSA